jgi:saccharopine dehydrogenase-like NADP-dependent oxidoreductase
VAGRSAHRARAFADELGHGASGLALDVLADGGALDLSNVSVVVMCVDQIDARFVKRCLASGVNYVDITAKQASIDAIEQLDHLARRHGSTAVLSVGLCPGVTNLLAAHAAQRFDTLTKIDLFVMIGSGDRHGPAAVEWILANLNRPFEVFHNGERRVVRGLGEHHTVRFPGDRSSRRAFRFNFPDQRTIVRTVGVPTASTWLSFDSVLLTGIARLLAPLVSGETAFAQAIRSWLARALPAVRFGSDVCHVLVRAEGQLERQTIVREFSLSSRSEAHVTGLVAAETVRMLVQDGRRAGVMHLEQLANPIRMLKRLGEVLPGTTLQM